ncbi:hypothetical protein GN244_ATG03575 [Phytophthora infestans]|uniref:Secreted RxLR effector peptide protein n=1 Tax=Phytophthora infestans TaxID=4787 RepID=A0A833W6A9_PHYIN|nr:hypothetical protein GN244_ATG03575 [Phytophthora infestans]KAF4139236.1 hypothetical protein GN958_ATG11596 [Phytophthora infestans]
MAWRLCVLLGATITLINIAAALSLAASVALNDKNIDTNRRSLRVAQRDEARTVASVETVTALVKSKSLINDLVDTLPSKLAELEKKYPIVIPGVSEAIIKARLKYAYWYGVPPTKIFKFLGLRGHSEARLHDHPLFKFYQEYVRKWGKSQEYLNIAW